MLLLLLFPSLHFTIVSSLSCIQCNRDEVYYSDWERQNCIYGRRHPVPCPNANDTICITDFHRSFDHWFYAFMDSGMHERQIMTRRCGTAADLSCTLYELPKLTEIVEETVVGHGTGDQRAIEQVDRATISQKPRRTQRPPLVRVCASTCNGRECLIYSSSSSMTFIYLTIIIISLSLLNRVDV